MVGLAWRGPVAIARATLRGAAAHGVVIGAAGCAFFTTLAVFPAMSILIALYGMLFNPRTIEPQLQALSTLLPDDAFDLISRWMHHLVLQSRRSLGIGIGVGTVITIVSSTSGTRALLATLAASHDAALDARPWRQHLLALVLTTLGIGAAIGGIALLTLLPIAAATLGLSRPLTPVTHAAGTIMLVALASLFLGVLYRIALPGPSPGARRHIVAGAFLATALWLLACWLISFYVDHVARFGPVYGPVGAVIGLMLWLYATFYAALMGAELNAQLDAARLWHDVTVAE